jgi:hypothetical protein
MQTCAFPPRCPVFDLQQPTTDLTRLFLSHHLSQSDIAPPSISSDTRLLSQKPSIKLAQLYNRDLYFAYIITHPFRFSSLRTTCGGSSSGCPKSSGISGCVCQSCLGSSLRSCFCRWFECRSASRGCSIRAPK